jgi:hypothetical protein
MNGNQDDPKSLLDDLRQHHIVRVHNPLSDPFSWTVARSINQLNPAHRDPYIDQLRMRNEAHPAVDHVKQTITIPASSSMNLPGDVAKVFVKHLIDEILARQGKRNISGNPELRRTTEEEVMLNTDDLRREMATLDIEAQLDQQIKDMNRDTGAKEMATNEQTFPDLGNGERSPEANSRSGRPPAKDTVAKGQTSPAQK